MTLPPSEAAMILTEHNAWRRGEVTNPMPYNPRMLGEAIDAAVAALESLDTITERARELIGLHMSEQEGMMLPTARQFTAAVDALAQAIGAAEATPRPEEIPTLEEMREILRHPRERALSHDAERGNFRYQQEDDGA